MPSSAPPGIAPDAPAVHGPRRNATATANLQHEASESGVGFAGASSETKDTRRKRREKTKKRSGAGLPERYGNGGEGSNQLLRRVRLTRRAAACLFLCSSPPPGISPEPPAAHGPLPGIDETARLPSPVSVLSPLAASRRPAGALSPTNVALFQTSRAPPRAA